MFLLLWLLDELFPTGGEAVPSGDTLDQRATVDPVGLVWAK